MKKESGFTFIELFLVLVIIAVLSVIAVSKYKGFLAVKLYNASRCLVSDIEYTQNLAEITQKNHRVVFYPGLDKYCVYEGTYTLVGDPVHKKPMVRNFIVSSEFKGIDIELAEFPVGTEYVEFNPIGVPASGGKVRLSYDGEIYEVYVENNTGNVTLQKIN